MASIFDIGDMMENIKQAFSEGREPDPAIVNLLIQEGPAAIEKWLDAIDEVQGEADILAKRIAELKGRMDARNQTVERMKGVLSNLLALHFDNKIKTPTFTAWNQSTESYEFTGTIPSAFLKPQEPKVDKKGLVDAVKAGQTFEGLEVNKNVSTSVRVRR